jgi:hypothetical protein
LAVDPTRFSASQTQQVPNTRTSVAPQVEHLVGYLLTPAVDHEHVTNQIPLKLNAGDSDLHNTLATLHFAEQTTRRADAFANAASATHDALLLPVEMARATDSINTLLHGEQLAMGVASATAAFSVGYVFWSLRAGALAATLLSSLPAWQSFDPLPVIDFYERKRRETNNSEDDGEIPLDQLLGRLKGRHT